VSEERPLNGLLGRGATYEGNLSFEGRVRVDGVFRGRIYTDELLEIGEEGRIEGEVDAQDLIVAGVIQGKVKVRGRLVLEATSRIEGEFDAKNLEVREGARIDARIRTRA